MFLKALLLAVSASFVAVTAQAAPILPGNTTNVTLTAAPVLASLGVSVSGLGTATISGPATAPVASFPITGGQVNTDGTAQIQHNGSGLQFSASATTFALTNFLVDTATKLVSANVAVNGSALAPTQIGVFDIGPNLGLSLTAAAAGALNSTFKVTAFSAGLAIGSATTNPIVGAAAVPEPGSVALLGAGVAAFFLFRRGSSRGSALAA